ncbi:hypothetical protein VP01_331g1 [Puccinia sorghi]|uniref:Uncharacterized protein n=1 Tax=Puccinia sorghi TaxID=27349 RepID=A0A0L6UX82_9BASI|nr:hypothetical protein VP01_331g1 [Puccinia sorghi]
MQHAPAKLPSKLHILFESILENGWSNNRSFLGLSANCRQLSTFLLHHHLLHLHLDLDVKIVQSVPLILQLVLLLNHIHLLWGCCSFGSWEGLLGFGIHVFDILVVLVGVLGGSRGFGMVLVSFRVAGSCYLVVVVSALDKLNILDFHVCAQGKFIYSFLTLPQVLPVSKDRKNVQRIPISSCTASFAILIRNTTTQKHKNLTEIPTTHFYLCYYSILVSYLLHRRRRLTGAVVYMVFGDAGVDIQSNFLFLWRWVSILQPTNCPNTTPKGEEMILNSVINLFLHPQNYNSGVIVVLYTTKWQSTHIDSLFGVVKGIGGVNPQGFISRIDSGTPNPIGDFGCPTPLDSWRNIWWFAHPNWVGCMSNPLLGYCAFCWEVSLGKTSPFPTPLNFLAG